MLPVLHFALISSLLTTNDILHNKFLCLDLHQPDPDILARQTDPSLLTAPLSWFVRRRLVCYCPDLDNVTLLFQRVIRTRGPD
ncbi:hypothetical protein PoB_000444700 [Plakobranchus ocellatus]|uniref:Secreted protein n=1 Tax=Plakobranchus ocellatus TaxID=259542 RepID=A0AAV3Y5B8_9GAST|nr:hypothetical protein PoB_000444700 [Plakobranchus ocellatus]